MSASDEKGPRDLATTSQAGGQAAGEAAGGVVMAVVASRTKEMTDGAAAVVSSVEVEGLSVEQRTVLESLAMGESVAATARKAGISRSTVYEWLKRDVIFQAAYNKWHELVEENCRARLAALMDKATRALERALDAGDAKTALVLLSGLGMVQRRGKRSTDPEVLRRREAAKEVVRREKLRRFEMDAKLFTKGGLIPFSELGR
jgi:alpha-beta hydrolase superfamily lysophospholipase